MPIPYLGVNQPIKVEKQVALSTRIVELHSVHGHRKREMHQSSRHNVQYKVKPK